ncbi:MAG: ABC transporter substrate-binding protein [Acidilobus sp.]
MRTYALAAIAVIVIAVVAGLAYAFIRPGQLVVTVGSISVGPSSFDAYRYDPEISNVTLKYDYVGYSLTPSLLDALLGGQVEVAILPADLAAIAILRSNDTYVIAVDYPLFQAIIVPGNSTIASPAQLAGKTVAIPVGTGTYYLFVVMMKDLYNLTVSPNASGPSVVHVVNVAPGEVIDAVETGSAQAGVVWEPMLSLALFKYHMRILATFQRLWQEMTGEPTAPFLVWVATSKLVSDRPLLVRALEVHADSAYAWDRNETLAVDALYKFYAVPPQVGELVWMRTNDTPTGLCITQAELQELMSEWEYLERAGMIPTTPSPSRVLTCATLGLG